MEHLGATAVHQQGSRSITGQEVGFHQGAVGVFAQGGAGNPLAGNAQCFPAFTGGQPAADQPFEDGFQAALPCFALDGGPVVKVGGVGQEKALKEFAVGGDQAGFHDL